LPCGRTHHSVLAPGTRLAPGGNRQTGSLGSLVQATSCWLLVPRSGAGRPAYGAAWLIGSRCRAFSSVSNSAECRICASCPCLRPRQGVSVLGGGPDHPCWIGSVLGACLGEPHERANVTKEAGSRQAALAMALQALRRRPSTVALQLVPLVRAGSPSPTASYRNGVQLSYLTPKLSPFDHDQPTTSANISDRGRAGLLAESLLLPQL